ncbi:MAG: Hsp20/alpha crystallin family protein [Anaerolineales bacterium]|nr:Hsp20/alpha crystallin family protein [Anaerolineales bacterium]
MLSRWDPFREFISLRDSMDRLFDRTLSRMDSDFDTVSWSLALDVVESNDEFVVKASLPGIEPDDLEITYSDNTLTIRGETKTEQEVEESRYHLRERRYGRFSRSVSLPSKINSDKIKADYNNGVLTLHLPKTEEVKPKRISVKAEGSKKMIEGKLK